MWAPGQHFGLMSDGEEDRCGGWVWCLKTKSFYNLKVVGNEKLGGLRFLQLLGIGLGPWRLMSILILNMPFANAKPISVSALSSKMNR